MIQKQKTILHFLSYSPQVYSGLDRFTIALSVELKKKGYQSVFVFDDEIGDTELEQDILTAGARIELLNTKKGMLETCKNIHFLLKKYRPKIVHSHFKPYIKNILAIMCFFYRIHFYFSNHSLKFKQSALDFRKEKGFLKALRWRIYFSLLLFLCDKSFCISEAIMKEYIDFSGINSKKLQILYIGVNTSLERQKKEMLRRELMLPLNKVLIVNVSAIDYVKGIDIIIKAAMLLSEKYKLNNFKIIHVGGLRSNVEANLKYADELKRLKSELLGDSDCFNWLGKRNDIHNILSACDIYIHPSRMEGISVAIMEACSAFLPILGSNVGGIPEIIKDDVNGLLIEPENEQQLAEALSKLISNEKLRMEMGTKSYQMVKEKWDMNKQVIKLVEAYGIQ